MKKLSALAVAAMLLFGIGLTACSSGEDVDELQKKKGTIDKITDKAAEKAVNKIRNPMDKARAIKGLSDQRTEAIDHATEH